ncbi:MAG: cytochrome c-type biogenesis protein CcmH [Alphaproteobacteria bacterium]|nr:cytochrome c-type biogenesis protein CcmH [Alphaproteobacteria bacterium]
MFKRLVILCIISIFSFHQAQAALKVVPLQDVTLEQRAKDLSLELRCLVCQNQSIESSDADLAIDLKILVREQILQGKTDLEIKQFLVDRYGEFVLLKPLFSGQNSFLWLTPVIFLALAFLSAYIYFRNMNKTQKDESADQ